MDNYVVSARKYRPTTFASVVGQKPLTATLKNAIATERLAHAYLFCGSRGVGKTSCARIFAKAINCTSPTADGEPCNCCESCRSFNEGRSLNIIELDAASNNGVDDIRSLVDQVQIPPTTGRYRVFIIDEVHMLTSGAFNAFLKTLEEPPSYVVFILATTEKHKIIPTILSRCQIYDFSRITVTDMVDHLEYVAKSEGITAERSALGVIAQKADGAMRDALSIFDQVAASSRGNITYRSAVDNLNVLDDTYYNRLMRAFINHDVPGALLVNKDIRDRGFDPQQMIAGLAAYVRNLMVARTASTRVLLDTDDQTREELTQLAAEVPIEFFYDAMSLCNEADLNYRQASSKNFLVELLLIRLCQLLGPSPSYSGGGEGQLKPIAASAPIATNAPAQVQTAAPAPAPNPGNRTTPATPAAPAVSTPPPPPVPPVQNGQRRTIKSVNELINGTQAGSANNRSSAAPTSAAPAQKRRNPFNMGQLRAAWDGYAAARPREKIIANMFRACRPTPTRDPEKFDVELDNKLQIEYLTKMMPELLAELRDKLGNDFLEINLLLSDKGPAPHIWNDQEVLRHLLETTPYLSQMMKELNLKLI